MRKLMCRNPRSKRSAFIWMIIMASALQAGCATTSTTQEGSFSPKESASIFSRNVPPVPSITERQKIGTVALVPAQYTPSSNFYTFAEGALAGAEKGAAAGGAESVFWSGAVLGVTALTMPAALAFAAPVAIVMMTISAAAATAAVAVQGASRGAAIAPDQREQMKSIIAEAVTRLDSQHVFAGRLDASVKTNDWVRLKTVKALGPQSSGDHPDYSLLHTERIDTILEAGITEIGFGGCGKGFDQQLCPGGSDKPMVYLFMIGRARLVRVTEGTQIYSNEFRYDSPPRELAEWAASNAEVFSEELERGYRDLAERINDELFMVTPIALPVPSYWHFPTDNRSLDYLTCWLHPIYPESEHRIFSAEGWKETFGQMSFSYFPFTPPNPLLSPLLFSALDSRRPTLRWSTFPREIDREKLDLAVQNSISEVTYDLRIWEVVDYSRGKLVYERNGLREPQHELESPLEPNRRYFWSFRARFRYDGLPMATRWAFARSINCDRDLIPSILYYRFVTPN